MCRMTFEKVYKCDTFPKRGLLTTYYTPPSLSACLEKDKGVKEIYISKQESCQLAFENQLA